MHRLDADDVPSYASTLVADAEGNVRLNSDIPARRHTFAMSAPASQTQNGATMNALIDVEVQRILNEGRTIARTILAEHNAQLLCLADALMEYEQLDRTQFESLFT